MKGFHESKLQLLDAGIQVLFSAQSTGVLEQRHYRFVTFVTHQRVRINGCLCSLAVLFPLMNDDRSQTKGIRNSLYSVSVAVCILYSCINIHFVQCLFRGFLESSETGIEVAVQEQRHFDRFIRLTKQALRCLAEAVVLIVRHVPPNGHEVYGGVYRHQHNQYYVRFNVHGVNHFNYLTFFAEKPF